MEISWYDPQTGEPIIWDTYKEALLESLDDYSEEIKRYIERIDSMNNEEFIEEYDQEIPLLDQYVQCDTIAWCKQVNEDKFKIYHCDGIKPSALLWFEHDTSKLI